MNKNSIFQGQGIVVQFFRRDVQLYRELKGYPFTSLKEFLSFYSHCRQPPTVLALKMNL